MPLDALNVAVVVVPVCFYVDFHCHSILVVYLWNFVVVSFVDIVGPPFFIFLWLKAGVHPLSISNF